MTLGLASVRKCGSLLLDYRVEGIKLVDEAKEPEGDLVAVACLDAVGHDIAVGEVGNLGEAFLLA